MAFSPDGASLASGSSGGKVHLWRVEDGTLLRSFHKQRPYNEMYIEGAEFSPDERLLALMGDDVVVLCGIK